jgi:hydrogenase maturation protease
MPSKTPIKIIGVGNPFRGDDAAGLWVVRRLKSEQLPRVEITENPGTATALASAWQNSARVIVVDAVVTGGQPGTISRFDAHDPGATFPVSRSPSSHGWGVAEAVALGRLLQELPPVLIIYGIEGQNFTLGTDSSPEVAAAIPEAARRIAEEVQAWIEPQIVKANKLPGNSSERRNNGT